jgi:hypothetical protein
MKYIKKIFFFFSEIGVSVTENFKLRLYLLGKLLDSFKVSDDFIELDFIEYD